MAFLEYDSISNKISYVKYIAYASAAGGGGGGKR